MTMIGKLNPIDFPPPLTLIDNVVRCDFVYVCV